MDVSLPTATLGSVLWTGPGRSQSELARKGVHCGQSHSIVWSDSIS